MSYENWKDKAQGFQTMDVRHIQGSFFEGLKKRAEALGAVSYTHLDVYKRQLLDISGTGVMGYIEIPTINISLPVYHGTEDAVLQIAVGHLAWSSLPVGGDVYKRRLRLGGRPEGDQVPPADAGEA